MMGSTNDVRPSPIAGTWYSNNAENLRREIASYLENAVLPDLLGEVIGLISPHAGYRYSGPTAGYAYRAVVGKKIDVVAIFSPYHDYTPEKLLTTLHSAYQTPLGNIPVAIDLLEEFRKKIKNDELDAAVVAYDKEHSLEIQLPFLQTALKGTFQLFPLMIRTQDIKEIEIIAKAAGMIFKNKRVLLVASTDLSHFYNEKAANNLDKEMLRRIEAFSPEQVLNAERDGKAFACGAGAVAAVLRTCQLLGARKVELLHYSTSAEQTQDFSSVVGYGAAAILR